eukprot:comp8637_c1_seq1/m.3929 comp8637_c1_seq1/g.3929  ORF comp8637_c1_seq1/g.3929 comp8637_c1_seq1/m.3929 type:complete len:159 (-) comp8637_c1_seq1:94-570(-)
MMTAPVFPTAVPALTGVGAATIGVFAGAAIYITAVEQRAWEELGDTHTALKVFQKTIWKAARMQGALAVVGGSSTLLAYLLQDTKDARLLAAGGLMLGMWPYTLAVLMPLNKTLCNDDAQKQTGDWKAHHLAKWDTYHRVRTAAGLVAFGTLVWAIID